MKKTIIFFLCFFMISNSFGQDKKPEEILKKANEVLVVKKSVSYKAVFRHKFFDGDSFSRFDALVKMERNSGDTIFGSRFVISDSFFIKVYDLNNIYVLEKSSKSGTKYYPHKGQDWPINGNTAAGLIWSDFIHPENILARIDPLNKLSLLKDTIIGKELCYKITIRYPDEEEFTEQMRTMCISKKTFLTRMTSFQIKYQGNFQYDELLISDEVFDKIKKDAFSIDKLKGYKIEEYKEPTAEETAEMYKLLDTNTLAPTLKGDIYLGEKNTEISYAGKVTMLDFWYMACGWCIKSVPYVEKLREKYGDKLQVIGLNSFDNNEKSKAKIPKFLEFNPMNYSILFVDKALVDAFRIKGWPTFYLIGPDGKVRFAQAGAIVNEETIAVWEKEIEKLLK